MRNIPGTKEEKSIVASQSLKEKEYWGKKLSGELTKCNFPFDYKNIALEQRKIAEIPFELTDELYAGLMKLSNHSDFKLHMILVAVLGILLYQYTGERDIIVGTTIDKQDHEGEFINTLLPLRNKLTPLMTFKDLLLEVRETVYGAIEHQNYPLESLLNDLKMAYTGDEFPLFDMAILLENIHDKEYLRDIPVNLLFCFSRGEKSLHGYLEYNGLLYEKSTLERIITYFMRILRQVLSNIDLVLDDIDIITGEEKKHLLFDMNRTAADYPRAEQVHQLFEEQVAKTPHHIAAVDGNCFVSYAGLNRKANQLACLLVDRGVKQDTVIGLLIKRSIEMIVGILGILKAGGAYLPLDPQSPIERIKFILEDSGASPVLTSKAIVEQTGFIKETILLDQGETYQNIPDVVVSGPGKPGRANHLAYLIYTSGTSGNPKGVLLDHRGLVNYVCWAAERYVKGERVNFPLYTSISFDLTVTSLFTPLITGNTIIVYESDANEFLIEKVIRENKVEVVKLTPSHLKLVGNNKEITGRSNIKRFIVGGENFDTELAQKIAGIFPGNIEIYNEYGPTEASVGCMIYQFKAGEEKRKSVPIGTPADNTGIYLLGWEQTLVPLGAVGEIHISGCGLARGYLNQPELTAEKFIATDEHGQTRTGFNQKFLHSKSAPLAVGDKLYRTGDLARWLPDGNLEFLGRRDQQINIRGFRVELGEIESHIMKYELIKEAVVTARDSVDGTQYLCAYVVSNTPEPLNVAELKTYLAKNLPDYMIPSYFVYLKEIPLTTNGKLDKKALPEPAGSMERDTEYVPPRNETENKLVEIWQKELGLEKVGVKDNFFNIGGDSIKSISLLNSINKSFNSIFKLVHLYRNASIEKFAVLIDQSDTGDTNEGYKNILAEIEEMKNEFLEGL